MLVAVIDDGVDATHPELAGRISPASLDINGGRGTLFDVSNTHGSELSAIIAGNFNNASTIGLAYNATILAVRADNSAGTFNSTDLAASVDYAIAQGAKVINFSLGSSTPSSTTFQTAIQRATTAGLIVVVSAGNDGPASGQVNFPGFLATNSTVSNNLIMVAGSHDRNGNQVSFSNVAGVAQNFYLTAPGLQIVVPDFGNPGGPAGFQVCPAPTSDAGTCQVQGTSYSSPYVTGAVALVLGAFPGLTPQQVVQLLLTSADDYGAPGVDAVVGHGRLNIQRAFQPVGTVSVPLAAGVAVPVGHPLGVSGEAFGEGLTEDPGLWRTVGFDALGRTFAVDLARSWRARGAATHLAGAPMVWRDGQVAGARVSFASEDRTPPQTLRTAFDSADVSGLAFKAESVVSRDVRVTFAANTAALSSLTGPGPVGAHLAFAGADASVAAAYDLGPNTEIALTAQGGVFDLGEELADTQRQAIAARLSHAGGPVGAALTVGTLREEGALLGLAWSERLGASPDAEAAFMGVEAYWRPTHWLTLFGQGEAGVTPPTRGWLSVIDPLSTTAFAFGASVEATPQFLFALGTEAHGRFGLTLSQPLRVEGGRLSVSLPQANAWGRSTLGYETRDFDPSPDGRELEVEAAWDVFISGKLSGRAAFSHTRNPGHRAGSDAVSRAEVSVRMNF